MIKDTIGPVHYRYFDSWGEFLALAEDGKSEMSIFSRQSRTYDAADWYGTSTFEEALDLARFGWPEGLERVSAIVERIKEVHSLSGSRVKSVETIYDLAGGFVDVGRFLSGEVECMGNFEEVIKEGYGKILTIALNISSSAGVSAEMLSIRGAATLALVDILEYCGRSCEVILTEATLNGYGGQLEYHVPIKLAGEMLDLDRLSFSMTHPSVLRRLMFSVSEQEDSTIRKLFNISKYGGYGTPTASVFKGDVYVDCQFLGRDFSNNSMATKWVMKELKAQGVIVDEEDL